MTSPTVVAPEFAATSKPYAADVETGGSSSAIFSDTTCRRLRMIMLVLNVAVVVFAIIALSCYGSATDNNWDGSMSVFALFTGLTSIGGCVVLACCRSFLVSTPATAVLVGYADIAFNFIYTVFWFATATDVVTSQSHDLVCDLKIDECDLTNTFVAFGYFAFMASAIATGVAVALTYKYRRDRS